MGEEPYISTLLGLQRVHLNLLECAKCHKRDCVCEEPLEAGQVDDSKKSDKSIFSD